MAVKKYYAKSSGYLVHGDRANHRYVSKFFKNGRWQYIYPEDRHKRADNAGRNARITLKPGMTMADAQKAAYDKAYAKSMRRTERHNRVVRTANRAYNKIKTIGNKKTTYSHKDYTDANGKDIGRVATKKTNRLTGGYTRYIGDYNKLRAREEAEKKAKKRSTKKKKAKKSRISATYSDAQIDYSSRNKR